MNLETAITQAIEYELRVRDHYAACARQSQDPSGRRVFAILAREEQGHVDHLEGLLKTLQAGGTVAPGEVPTVLPPLETIQAAAQMSGQLPQGPGTGLEELDFLKEALALERSTSAFYQSMVQGLAPEHRALFAKFLDIEDGHVTLVQAEIDSIVGHGHWFDVMEFRLEH